MFLSGYRRGFNSLFTLTSEKQTQDRLTAIFHDILSVNKLRYKLKYTSFYRQITTHHLSTTTSLKGCVNIKNHKKNFQLPAIFHRYCSSSTESTVHFYGGKVSWSWTKCKIFNRYLTRCQTRRFPLTVSVPTVNGRQPITHG